MTQTIDHEGADVASVEDAVTQGVGDPDDVNGYGIKVLASLGLQLGKITDTCDAITTELRKLRAREAQFPIRHRSVKSAVAVTGTNLVIGHGGPQQGRRWNVRQSTTAGVTPTTVAAGQAFFFKTALSPALEPNLISGSDSLYDIAAAFPSVAFYGARDVEVEAGEMVFCVIVGGTNGQSYVSTITVDDFPMAPDTDYISA